MTHSKKYEKSRGALIFATNTATVDYETIAHRASKFVEKNLGLPVEVVTIDSARENKRFSIDSGQFETWKNFGRYNAYAYSPWDETLLLDSDYLVLDDSINKLFDTVQDYALHDKNLYLDDFTRQEPMGTHSLDMLWATVIVFKKTAKSKMLFSLVERIERNYPYYRKLYNITKPNFRNDYAFTIADNIINGYTQNTPECRIPWPLVTISEPVKSMELTEDQLVIKESNCAHVLPKCNIHVLGKQYLMSQQFKELINDKIC